MRDTIVAERYFRSWEREGRRQLGEKLAIALDGWDDDTEQLRGRLKALDWKEHHATWDPDYEFAHYDRDESGAWTCDYDTQTVAALRERGLRIPDREAIPVKIDVHHHRRTDPDRNCPACGKDRICSEHDIRGAFPGSERGTAMRALLETREGTHICTYCRRIFSMETAETVQTRDVAVDLSEAM